LYHCGESTLERDWRAARFGGGAVECAADVSGRSGGDGLARFGLGRSDRLWLSGGGRADHEHNSRASFRPGFDPTVAGLSLVLCGALVCAWLGCLVAGCVDAGAGGGATRSEEHTSELQSQSNLVCRLLLEKK